MAIRNYNTAGLILKEGISGFENEIRELQRDLRELGYLKRGIDGKFGPGTELAVKGLQHDLLHNDGSSTQNDGIAPVKVKDFNQGRVTAVTGIIDHKLADCISDLLDNPDFPVLPKADQPKLENETIVAVIKAVPSHEVPIPFLVAMLKQESGLRHFNEPAAGDEDTYIVVGLDRNNKQETHAITSRGYGVGQYTLFHHPPHSEEVEDFMNDVEKNINKAVWELRYKFDYFVNGNDNATRADDRIEEYGPGPLRMCEYSADDPRFMKVCKQCMIDAGQTDIIDDVTPFYEGCNHVFEPTQYYPTANYQSVPIRKNLKCDWAYAARRYNGSGVNSYHYQTITLKNVLDL